MAWVLVFLGAFLVVSSLGPRPLSRRNLSPSFWALVYSGPGVGLLFLAVVELFLAEVDLLQVEEVRFRLEMELFEAAGCPLEADCLACLVEEGLAGTVVLVLLCFAAFATFPPHH